MPYLALKGETPPFLGDVTWHGWALIGHTFSCIILLGTLCLTLFRPVRVLPNKNRRTNVKITAVGPLYNVT